MEMKDYRRGGTQGVSNGGTRVIGSTWRREIEGIPRFWYFMQPYSSIQTLLLLEFDELITAEQSSGSRAAKVCLEIRGRRAGGGPLVSLL